MRKKSLKSLATPHAPDRVGLSGTYDFVIYGQPVPKQSTRFDRGSAHADPRVVAHELKIQLAAKAAGVPMLDGYFSVSATFYLQDERVVDLENLWKACGDALQGIVWKNDSQICHLATGKTFNNPKPLTQIRISNQHLFIGPVYEATVT